MEPFPVFFLKEESKLEEVSVIGEGNLKKDHNVHEQNKNIEYLQELTKMLPSINEISNNASNESTLRE